MIEIYQNGVLKMTIEEVGSHSDFIVIPREVSQSCSMSAEGFKAVFHNYMKDSKTNLEAYEKTEQYHQQLFTERKYSGYTSFAVAMSKAHKRG